MKQACPECNGYGTVVSYLDDTTSPTTCRMCYGTGEIIPYKEEETE